MPTRQVVCKFLVYCGSQFFLCVFILETLSLLMGMLISTEVDKEVISQDVKANAWLIFYMVAAWSLAISLLLGWVYKEDLLNKLNVYDSSIADKIKVQLFFRANKLNKEAAFVFVIIVAMVVVSAVVFFKASSLMDGGDQIMLRSMDPKTMGEAFWIAPVVLVSTFRIGIIVFSSFLTFFLIRIYRYKLRLSAFYLSRFDAFAISGEAYKQIPAPALSIIMDASLDFGAHHTTLSQELAEILKVLHLPRRPATGAGPEAPTGDGG